MRPSIAILAAFAAAAAAEPIEIRANPTNAGAPPKQTPSEAPRIGAPTSHGCFSSSGELQDYGGYLPNTVSQGKCGNEICPPHNATVFATKGEKCYCGFSYPPLDTVVDDSNCNSPCPGYPFEACGGIPGVGKSFFSVYNSGLEFDVPYAGSASSSTPSSTGDAPPSSTGEPPKKSANVGGIAAGVVVAVVVVAGLVGGGFFYMRRKRNKEIEEEHRRNAAVSSFVGGGKPPSSSGGLSMTDSRLDPVMANHRLSTGSIADNQDYSRKILRVTNA